jgi:exportin-1
MASNGAGAPSTTAEMEEARRRLLDYSQEFDVALLDKIATMAYDPSSSMRAAANTCLMSMQESPDLWTRADGILEHSTNATARFFALQVLDDAIKTR